MSDRLVYDQSGLPYVGPAVTGVDESLAPIHVGLASVLLSEVAPTSDAHESLDGPLKDNVKSAIDGTATLDVFDLLVLVRAVEARERHGADLGPDLLEDLYGRLGLALEQLDVDDPLRLSYDLQPLPYVDRARLDAVLDDQLAQQFAASLCRYAVSEMQEGVSWSEDVEGYPRPPFLAGPAYGAAKQTAAMVGSDCFDQIGGELLDEYAAVLVEDSLELLDDPAPIFLAGSPSLPGTLAELGQDDDAALVAEAMSEIVIRVDQEPWVHHLFEVAGFVATTPPGTLSFERLASSEGTILRLSTALPHIDYLASDEEYAMGLRLVRRLGVIEELPIELDEVVDRGPVLYWLTVYETGLEPRSEAQVPLPRIEEMSPLTAAVVLSAVEERFDGDRACEVMERIVGVGDTNARGPYVSLKRTDAGQCAYVVSGPQEPDAAASLDLAIFRLLLECDPSAGRQYLGDRDGGHLTDRALWLKSLLVYTEEQGDCP